MRRRCGLSVLLPHGEAIITSLHEYNSISQAIYEWVRQSGTVSVVSLQPLRSTTCRQDIFFDKGELIVITLSFVVYHNNTVALIMVSLKDH